MKGDINQDNSINIYDLVMLIEFIFSGNTVPDNLFHISDINYDNHINSDDIVSLIYLIVNTY